MEAGAVRAIFCPAAPLSVFVLVAIVGAVVGGLIGYFPLAGMVNSFLQVVPLPRAEVAAFGGLAGMLVLLCLAKNGFQEQETVIDFRRGRVMFRVGVEQDERPLEQIRGLIFSARRRTQSSSIDNENSESWEVVFGGRLDLSLADQDVLLLQTSSLDLDPAEARALLRPVGEAGPRWACRSRNLRRGQGAVRRPKWLKLTWLQAALVGGLALVGIGGLAVAKTIDSNVMHHVAAARCWRQCSLDEQPQLRRSDRGQGLLNVEFKNGAGVDDQLADATESGRAAENRIEPLEDRRQRSRSVATAQVADLQILDLSETHISDAGLAELPELPELVYLTLAITGVGDGGLKRLPQATPNLQFLLLGGTRITDEGLNQIGQLKQLKHVFFFGPLVTPAAMQRLQQALPARKSNTAGERATKNGRRRQKIRVTKRFAPGCSHTT